MENNQLQRPGYGMGDRKEELEVQLEGETQPFEMTVTVQGRRYTSRQAEELLERREEIRWKSSCREKMNRWTR